MANFNSSFWIALIKYCQDREVSLARLWNGYIGWKLSDQLRDDNRQSGRPQFVVDAPPGGWPELNKIEKYELEELAVNNGGHPSWKRKPYMNLSEQAFSSETNFSDLTFIAADFSRTTFNAKVKFENAHFFMRSCFCEAGFVGIVNFNCAIFETDVDFDQAQFGGSTSFVDVQFNGGATFFKSTFSSVVRFDGSKFSEKFRSGASRPIHLAKFTGVEFQGLASFNNVSFGEDPNHIDTRKTAN